MQEDSLLFPEESQWNADGSFQNLHMDGVRMNLRCKMKFLPRNPRPQSLPSRCQMTGNLHKHNAQPPHPDLRSIRSQHDGGLLERCSGGDAERKT